MPQHSDNSTVLQHYRGTVLFERILFVFRHCDRVVWDLFSVADGYLPHLLTCDVLLEWAQRYVAHFGTEYCLLTLRTSPRASLCLRVSHSSYHRAYRVARQVNDQFAVSQLEGFNIRCNGRALTWQRKPPVGCSARQRARTTRSFQTEGHGSADPNDRRPVISLKATDRRLDRWFDDHDPRRIRKRLESRPRRIRKCRRRFCTVWQLARDRTLARSPGGFTRCSAAPQRMRSFRRVSRPLRPTLAFGRESSRSDQPRLDRQGSRRGSQDCQEGRPSRCPRNESPRGAHECLAGRLRGMYRNLRGREPDYIQTAFLHLLQKLEPLSLSNIVDAVPSPISSAQDPGCKVQLFGTGLRGAEDGKEHQGPTSSTIKAYYRLPEPYDEPQAQQRQNKNSRNAKWHAKDETPGVGTRLGTVICCDCGL